MLHEEEKRRVAREVIGRDVARYPNSDAISIACAYKRTHRTELTIYDLQVMAREAIEDYYGLQKEIDDPDYLTRDIVNVFGSTNNVSFFGEPLLSDGKYHTKTIYILNTMIQHLTKRGEAEIVDFESLNMLAQLFEHQQEMERIFKVHGVFQQKKSAGYELSPAYNVWIKTCDRIMKILANYGFTLKSRSLIDKKEVVIDTTASTAAVTPKESKLLKELGVL
jgi:hypothetical protein